MGSGRVSARWHRWELGIREIQALSGNGQPPTTSELERPFQGMQGISRRVLFISEVFAEIWVRW